MAVRIIRRGDVYHVIGRNTSCTFFNFDDAWTASIPYFAGRKW